MKQKTEHLFTIDICPECGLTFNKHITAVYCSKRCSNRASSRRRHERALGPSRALHAITTRAYDVDIQSGKPLPRDVLRRIEDRIYQDHKRDGIATPEDFPPTALGDYVCANPGMVLREKPRLTDDEPQIISMGHFADFGEAPPKPELPPQIESKPTSITDSLLKEHFHETKEG